MVPYTISSGIFLGRWLISNIYHIFFYLYKKASKDKLFSQWSVFVPHSDEFKDPRPLCRRLLFCPAKIILWAWLHPLLSPSCRDVILLSVVLLAEWSYNACVRFVELKFFVLSHQPGNCYFVRPLSSMCWLSNSLSLIDTAQQILSPFLTCSLIRNVAGNLVCPSFILWCCVIVATTNILLSDLRKTITCDKNLELLD